MTDVTSETPVAPDEAPDDDLFDEEWLSTDTKHHRLRNTLIVLLLAACVFYAGTLVQKHYGSASSDTAAAATGGMPSMPEGAGSGFPGGSFPSDGAAPSGGASAGGGGTGQSDTTTPAVVGTIKKISGHTWTVTDFGGKAHKVRVSDSTEVTHELGASDDAIRVGASVSIVGETADSGLVTATAVTFR